MYKEINTLIEMKNCETEYGLGMIEVLNIFSGKWKMLIIGAIFEKDIRFNEIHKLIPSITARMLSRELKDLEMNGIVKRTVADSKPALIKYGLTESATGLSDNIKALIEWGIKHRKINIGL